MILILNIINSGSAASLRALIEAETIALDRLAAEAGIALLRKGGDLADGGIAHEGRWLGGDISVSFDEKAVRLLRNGGQAARLPA